MDEFTEILKRAVLARKEFDDYDCKLTKWCPGHDFCSQPSCEAHNLFLAAGMAQERAEAAIRNLEAECMAGVG